MKRVLANLMFALGMMFIFSTTAYAYLDPSVMTYAIQVIAGVVVAVGAVIGVYWRKAKKKIQNKLGIDENAKKEIEEEVVEIKEKH